MILLEVIIGDASFLRNQFANQHDMVVKVINGHRPNISEELRLRQPEMVDLVERCWDADYTNRPSFEYICERFEAYALVMQQGNAIIEEREASEGDATHEYDGRQRDSNQESSHLSSSENESGRADAATGGAGGSGALGQARSRIVALEKEMEEKQIEYERSMTEKATMFQEQIDRVTQVML
jgi:hypothetical protein